MQGKWSNGKWGKNYKKNKFNKNKSFEVVHFFLLTRKVKSGYLLLLVAQ